MYFKEVEPRPYKAGLIIIFIIISSILISISLSNPSNYTILPFTIGISVLLVIYSFFYLLSHNKIGILDDYISVSKRGRYKSILDVEGKIKIINGKIHIPYNEIQEIQVSDNKIYLKYQGLLNFIVLEPIDLEKFLSVFKSKLVEKNLDIPINVNEFLLKDEYIVFRNNILSNIPTIMAFTIFLSFPNGTGIYYLIKDGYSWDFFAFSLVTFLVTIGIYYTIYMYRELMIFGDNELIKLTKYGNMTLGVEKTPYEEIKSARKTKWRVDLKTKSGYMYLVPSKKDAFYKMINEKITTEIKNNNK